MNDPIDPATTALLLMDFQPGIVGRLPDPEPLLDATTDALRTARSAGLNVGYVRVAFEEGDWAGVPAHSSFAAYGADEQARARMDAGQPATQVHERLAPRPEDIVVRKTRVGPFTTTDLEAQLRARGVRTLVLAGISTSGVVLSTVRQGADMDFRLLVLADACADPDAEVHDVLMRKVLPRQAEVLTTAELAERLGS